MKNSNELKVKGSMHNTVHIRFSQNLFCEISVRCGIHIEIPENFGSLWKKSEFLYFTEFHKINLNLYITFQVHYR